MQKTRRERREKERMNEMAISHPEKIGGFERYEVENAADSLIRAEEIRLQPKLFGVAKKFVIRKRMAAAAVKMTATKLAGERGKIG